jgi:peptidoglycan/LPS O-acetylase OafA/YrhL
MAALFVFGIVAAGATVPAAAGGAVAAAPEPGPPPGPRAPLSAADAQRAPLLESASAAGTRRVVPWGWIAVALFAVVALGCATSGTPRVIDNLYWIDLVLGAAMACALAAAVRPGGVAVRRVLERGPLVRIGHFSYSLYLTHAPVLLVVWLFVVEPLRLSPNAGFALLVALAMPLIVAVGYGFFRCAERPFLARAANA